MPIISSTGKTIYSRHDQLPRPVKKKLDSESSTSSVTGQLDSSATRDPSKLDLMSLLKEGGFFLLLVILVSWALQSRQHGLISSSHSVMSVDEAIVFTNYLDLSSQEIFLSPPPILNNSSQDDSAHTTDIIPEHYLQGPCGDSRHQVFEGGKVTVSYELTSLSVDDQSQPLVVLSTSTPIHFTVKSVQDAIHTGSTLPLLHYMTIGLCKGQTKSLQFTQELFDQIPPNDVNSFSPTNNQFLTMLFPTLSTTTMNDKQQKIRTSTLALPLTFKVTVDDVESVETLRLKFQEEEKVRLQNGDISAFFRATLGKIHPVFLLIAYVGVRFGSQYYKRMRINSLKKKRLQEGLKAGKTEEMEVTYDDVIQDEINQEVSEAMAEQSN
jgi:hypothetical protein